MVTSKGKAYGRDYHKNWSFTNFDLRYSIYRAFDVAGLLLFHVLPGFFVPFFCRDGVLLCFFCGCLFALAFAFFVVGLLSSFVLFLFLVGSSFSLFSSSVLDSTSISSSFFIHFCLSSYCHNLVAMLLESFNLAHSSRGYSLFPLWERKSWRWIQQSGYSPLAI